MNDKEIFKTAIENNDINLLKKTAKGELHNHLTLGLSSESFSKLAGSTIKIPKRYYGLSGMLNFIAKNTRSATYKIDNFEKIVEMAVQQALNDGIVVLHGSIDLNLMKVYDKPAGFIEFIGSLVKKYKTRMDFRPVIGINRPFDFHTIEKRLYTCLDSGVFRSIDSYGMEETRFNPVLKPVYSYARKKRINTKIHIGEFSNYKSVAKTIEEIEVDEIQHGISVSQSEDLIKLIKEKNIILNICPTSNIKLGAVRNLRKHPIRKLFDSGIKVTVNTDDILLFGSTLSEEFLKLYQSGLFDSEELDQIRMNGLDKR